MHAQASCRKELRSYEVLPVTGRFILTNLFHALLGKIPFASEVNFVMLHDHRFSSIIQIISKINVLDNMFSF